LNRLAIARLVGQLALVTLAIASLWVAWTTHPFARLGVSLAFASTLLAWTPPGERFRQAVRGCGYITMGASLLDLLPLHGRARWVGASLGCALVLCAIYWRRHPPHSAQGRPAPEA
jgi:hypothetical protein